MPILHPTVENPDELLAWPATDGPVNRIQIERSATGGGTGYANVGSVTIVAATYSYTFYDTGSGWYRWYVSNAANTFPTSGERTYSDELQPTDAGGLICSLYDAKQRIGEGTSTDTALEESLLDFIRDATADIEGYTRRWLVPRGSATYLLSPPETGRRLFIPKGVRSITSLGYATSDQPDTAGTYTTIGSAYYSLWPPEIERRDGWPATGVQLLSTAPALFYAGINTVQATFSGGWSAVPADVQGVGLNLVVGLYRAQGSGGGDTVTVGMDGERTFERVLSSRDLAILKRYRDWA